MMNSLFSLDEAALDRHLQNLAARPWLPGELLEIVSKTLRLQLAAYARLSPPEMNGRGPAGPGEHWQGAPLLPAANFPVDLNTARLLWDELCALLVERGGKVAQAVQSLQREVQGDTALPVQAFRAFLRDESALFLDWAERFPEAPALLRFLAQAALSPQLAVVSEALADGHAAARVWEHGHCPHCGRPPFMGELRGKEGQRRHTCSFCGADWRAARLQCPFCLERGEDKLRMFTTDSLPFFEVQVCNACGNYLKLADQRERIEALPAALSDLASLPLDMLARQQGYARPTPSAWGF